MLRTQAIMAGFLVAWLLLHSQAGLGKVCRDAVWIWDTRGRQRCLERSVVMLWTIAVILAVLWLLGLVTSYTLGGFIHLLLLLAIVAVLIRLIQGRRVV